jgi:hypothetical protein
MWRPEHLRDRLRKTPFQPLAFYDTLNRRYVIRHPEMAMVGERYVTIGIPSKKKGIFSRTVNVALAHIVRWEDLPVPGKSGGNGHGSGEPSS